MRALAYKHFGNEEAAWRATENADLLWDQLKCCGVNMGDYGDSDS